MALVDDHMPVRRDQVVNMAYTHEALDHRHIELAIRGVLAGADLADRLGRETQEHGQLRSPLIEARLAVDQHEGTSGSRCDQICADDGLAHARQRDEHTDVVTEQGPRGLFLDGRQPTLEGDLQRLAVTPLIFDAE